MVTASGFGDLGRPSLPGLQLPELSPSGRVKGKRRSPRKPGQPAPPSHPRDRASNLPGMPKVRPGKGRKKAGGGGGHAGAGVEVGQGGSLEAQGSVVYSSASIGGFRLLHSKASEGLAGPEAQTGRKEKPSRYRDVSHMMDKAGHGSALRFDNRPFLNFQLPKSHLPGGAHQVEASPIAMSTKFTKNDLGPMATGGDATYDPASNLWMTPVFPSRMPSGRSDVFMLEEWMKKELARAVESLSGGGALSEAGDKPPEFAYLRDLNTESFKVFLQVYETVMHELLRQVSVQCVERGFLLAHVWSRISELISAQLEEQSEKLTSVIQSNIRLVGQLNDMDKTCATLREEKTEVFKPVKRLEGYVKELELNVKQLQFEVKEKDSNIGEMNYELISLNEDIPKFLPSFFDYVQNAQVMDVVNKVRVMNLTDSQALEFERCGTNMVKDIGRMLRHVMDIHHYLGGMQKYFAEEPTLKEKMVTLVDQILGLNVDDTFKAQIQAIKEKEAIQKQFAGLEDELLAVKRELEEVNNQIYILQEDNKVLESEVEEKDVEIDSLREQYMNMERKNLEASEGAPGSLAFVCPKCNGKDFDDPKDKNPFKKKVKEKKPSCIPEMFHDLLTTPEARAMIPLTKFPDTVHLIPVRVLSRTILQMFEDMVNFYEGNRPPLQEFLYEFMLRKYGLVGLAEKYLVDFLASLQKHHKQSKQIDGFSRFCGLGKALPEEGLAKILQVYSCIQSTPLNWADKALAKEIHSNKGNVGKEMYSLERVSTAIKKAFHQSTSEKIQRILEEVREGATQGGVGKQTYKQVDWDNLVDLVIKEATDESEKMNKELQRLFEEGDDNNDGILSLDEFQNIVHRVNPKIKLAEILKLFRQAMQLSGGSSISPADFATVMTKHEVLRASLEVKQGFRRNSTLPMPLALSPKKEGEGDTYQEDAIAKEKEEQFAILEDTWRSSSLIIHENLQTLEAANHPSASTLYEDSKRIGALISSKSDTETCWNDYRSFMSTLSKYVTAVRPP